ncbi:alkaline ceramidase 2 [Caerostris darwini]|uniref:Alkaline ceramidase n=1 Tax=Caerostris darwini TaxID=1538125 RepID=A0AAV4NEL3_9ARAC|nr:alkaline ceramidase 2 [Caerostris darwini]
MQHSPWPLRRGTSPVDWCEGNYLFSPVIAEFVNTVSNILFFIYPPLLTSLFREYAQCVNRGVYLIWGLLLTVGLTSAYFHATLSLVGQLLDEVAILWLLMASFALWLPRRYFSYGFKERKHFQLSMFILSCAATLMACVHPVLNAFALMCLGIPATALLIIEIRRCKNARVVNLGYRCAWVWMAALVCWINDRLFCEIWSKLNFPYLHGAWHILIAIVAYSACVLFAYFDALDTVPEQLPAIRFWPSDRFELGVPYIILRNARKDFQKI